jgi:hypothetical protein
MKETNPIQNPNPTSEAIRGSTPNDITEPENKKLLKSKWPKLLIVVITLALISLPAGIYFLNKNSATKAKPSPTSYQRQAPTQNLCPKDLKKCSNTASVERSGPNCEFRDCPGESTSPDGTKKLTLKSKDLEGSEQDCKLFLSDIQSGSEQMIFSEIGSPAMGCFGIDKNSWSSDGKYFYISLGGPDYVSIKIFKTDGSRFINGEKNIDMATLLKNKTGYYMDAGYKWNSSSTIYLKSLAANFQKGPTYIFNLEDLTFKTQ